MKQTGERETFVVRILNTQNATWQGTVTWTDGKRMESFRSALELIRLIDSTLLGAGRSGHGRTPRRGRGVAKQKADPAHVKKANRPKGRDAKPRRLRPRG